MIILGPLKQQVRGPKPPGSDACQCQCQSKIFSVAKIAKLLRRPRGVVWSEHNVRKRLSYPTSQTYHIITESAQNRHIKYDLKSAVQSYSEPIAMLMLLPSTTVEWNHWFVSSTTTTYIHFKLYVHTCTGVLTSRNASITMIGTVTTMSQIYTHGKSIRPVGGPDKNGQRNSTLIEV